MPIWPACWPTCGTLRRSIPTPAAAAGSAGAGRGRRVREGYEAQRRDGRLPASFEVVYGHAWKVAPRTGADGLAIVQFDPTRRGKGKP